MPVRRPTESAPQVKSWSAFDRLVRQRGYRLLSTLDQYSDPLLVSGCQRSGTTILTRLLTAADEIQNPWASGDEELQAANVLSGSVTLCAGTRYCFQTTYLNNKAYEYLEHDNYKLLWVVRNPHSVVQSMIYNWKAAALNRLYRDCGSPQLSEKLPSNSLYRKLFPLNRLHKACSCYKVKTEQLFYLHDRLPTSKLMIMDYDDFLDDAYRGIKRVCHFANVTFDSSLARMVRSKAESKPCRFDTEELQMISRVCEETYRKAKKLVST